MVQILYSIAAILLLGMSVLNINVKIHGTQERLMFNELALGMTSVGAEMLNEIGKHDFDPGTISGMMVSTDSLSYSSAFGSGSCNPDANFDSCFTVSDFHGKAASRTITRVHSGTPYTVTYEVTDIDVQYVSETAPHTPVANATDRTFAKEVTLTISTPVLVDGNGDPFEVTMSRVFMYPNI